MLTVYRTDATHCPRKYSSCRHRAIFHDPGCCRLQWDFDVSISLAGTHHRYSRGWVSCRRLTQGESTACGGARSTGVRPNLFLPADCMYLFRWLESYNVLVSWSAHHTNQFFTQHLSAAATTAVEATEVAAAAI